MTRKHKPFFAALLAVLLVLTCMAPLPIYSDYVFAARFGCVSAWLSAIN